MPLDVRTIRSAACLGEGEHVALQTSHDFNLVGEAPLARQLRATTRPRARMRTPVRLQPHRNRRDLIAAAPLTTEWASSMWKWS
jgi:hypothetical protein